MEARVEVKKCTYKYLTYVRHKNNFSTSIDRSWTYGFKSDMSFDATFKKVNDLILLAGQAIKISQHLHKLHHILIEKIVLDNMREVKSLEMSEITLPNLHYNAVDFSEFKSVNVIVYFRRSL